MKRFLTGLAASALALLAVAPAASAKDVNMGKTNAGATLYYLPNENIVTDGHFIYFKYGIRDDKGYRQVPAFTGSCTYGKVSAYVEPGWMAYLGDATYVAVRADSAASVSLLRQVCRNS